MRVGRAPDGPDRKGVTDRETLIEGRQQRCTPQGELARKLKLLLAASGAERGKPLTFRELNEAMTARGVKMTRARWTYMTDGTGRLIHDQPLLAALAAYFNVDSNYLLGVEDVETPELAGVDLELVTVLRTACVRSFAARTLGDVPPETLQAIVDFLSSDIAPVPGFSPVREGPPPITAT